MEPGWGAHRHGVGRHDGSLLARADEVIE